MNINSRTSKINFTGYASGTIASFTGLRDAPIKVKSYINFIQTGSGDPAPDNIRPITGRDSVTITANSVDHMISLGETVYGGSLDVTTGVLTVTNVSVDMGSLDWSRKRTSTTYFYFIATPEPFKADNFNFISSVYNNVQQIRTRLNDKEMGLFNNTSTETYRQIVVRDDDYETAETFIASVTGQQIVYELATPITVQLTPTQIEQLLGTNNVFADCGNVEVYYVTI